MVLIAVHGAASRLLPAERGTVRLVLEVEHDDRATALRQVTALHERFVAEAEALVSSGAATRWTASRVHVRSERRWEGEPGTSRVVQLGGATVDVRFQDFEALSVWILEAGAVDSTTVEGVDWSVTRAHRVEVERQLRIEAVRDAEQRAAAYASAIGATVVTLQAVWEEGLRHGGQPPQSGWVAQSRAARPALELRPDDLELGASVTADFLVGTPGGA